MASQLEYLVERIIDEQLEPVTFVASLVLAAVIGFLGAGVTYAGHKPYVAKRVKRHMARWLKDPEFLAAAKGAKADPSSEQAKAELKRYITQALKGQDHELVDDLMTQAYASEAFAPAPQMGDIDPTPEDDEDRPLVDKRPEGGGMDISQHHKMMWAEDVAHRGYHEEDSEQERLVDIILMRRNMGQEVEDIVDGLKDRFTTEDIYLAYEAAKMLESAMPREDGEILDEMSAISGGGAGLASAGKVSATSAGSAWKSNRPEHELMWSGDLPHSERPPSPNAKKKELTS